MVKVMGEEWGLPSSKKANETISFALDGGGVLAFSKIEEGIAVTFGGDRRDYGILLTREQFSAIYLSLCLPSFSEQQE